MIRTLLKIRLRSMLGSITSGKKRKGKETVSKGKIILISLVYLYLIVVFGGLFTGLAVSMAPVLIAAKLDWFYFSAFNIVAFALVFIFSIFETKSELFECKDNELLLSMPIKPRHIVLSRIFTVLVYNYLETALVMLPAIVVYIIFGGAVRGIIGSIMIFVLMPLLATSLASGVGYLVAVISKRLKNNTLITTLVSLVFLALYFWFYSAFMGSAGEEIDFVALSKSFTGVRFFGEASMLHYLYTSLFVVVTLAVTSVAYMLISKSYISIVTATYGGKKKIYKAQKLKKGSSFVAIAKKEFSLFFSSATYILNAGLGVIFIAVIGVILLMNNDTVVSLIAELTELSLDSEQLSSSLAALFASALIIVGSTNTISAPALSLEGKRLWIMKTMPISGRTILFAKTVPAILLPVIPNLFASVCGIIVFKTDIISSVFLMIIPIASGVMSAFLGIVFNALLPKFSYENEAQAVKQSMSVFLAMLATTLYGFIALVISFVFSFVLLFPFLGMLVVLLLTIAVAVSLALLIAGPLGKKIDKMSL